MSEKTWGKITATSIILLVCGLIAVMFFSGDYDGFGGDNTLLQEVWVGLWAVISAISLLLLGLSAVRKATGNQVTVKTVILTLLWIAGIWIVIRIF